LIINVRGGGEGKQEEVAVVSQGKEIGKEKPRKKMVVCL